MSALDRVELVLLVRDEMARREAAGTAAGVQAALSAAPSTTGVGGPGPSPHAPPARSWSPLGGEGVGSRQDKLLLAAPLHGQADAETEKLNGTGEANGGTAGNPENPAPAPKPPALATTKGADVSLRDDVFRIEGDRNGTLARFYKNTQFEGLGDFAATLVSLPTVRALTATGLAAGSTVSFIAAIV